MFLRMYNTGLLMVNTYFVADEATNEAIIIDLGGNYNKIKKDADDLGFKIQYILNTHGHFDHILGDNEAKEKDNLPVYMSEKDKFHAENIQKLIDMWGIGIQANPVKIDNYIDETSKLKIGKLPIKIFETPGHSQGSLSFLIEDKLFSGDALFQGSIGRCDFQDSDYGTLINSIKTKLMTLPDNTIVYPGHGASTTIGEERKYNEFIK